jgi:hypothetical protein
MKAASAKPIDFGRQLKMRREQQMNNFIDLTYPKIDQLTMHLLHYKGPLQPTLAKNQAKQSNYVS